jgi:SIR2-like domain
VEEKDWRTLLDKIEMGSCTPFIGAGASRPSLPGGADLAELLLVEDEASNGTSAPITDRTDLAKVTQYLVATYEDAPLIKTRIAKRIDAAVRPSFEEDDEPHRILAQLPLPIYLTTNYDDFMMRALQAERKTEARREICRWNKSLMDDVSSVFDSGFEPEAARPVVFHLHGHSGLPESMVATEDDYLDFLVNTSKDLAGSPAGQQRAVLPVRIRRAITNSTLLFLGYGLADINFRVILRGLVGSLEPSRRHIQIAVQYLDSKESADVKEYLEQYFRWTLDVKVFWGTSREFAAELNKRWKTRK